jgi:glyoxylase-like metal-dependent hydrolase (beta-lactamase superfamily II)
MGRQFDFTGITLMPPTSTFEREFAFDVGSKRVTLLDVGPAHTAGDTIVHVPSDRTVFTGDILFNQSHPIMWTGPVANWIGACQYVLGLDLETVVPGHGPITDKAAVREMKGYFEYVAAEARKRFDAQMPYEDRDARVAGRRRRGDPARVHDAPRLPADRLRRMPRPRRAGARRLGSESPKPLPIRPGLRGYYERNSRGFPEHVPGRCPGIRPAGPRRFLGTVVRAV